MSSPGFSKMPNNIQTSVRIYEAIKEQLAFEHDLLPEDQCLIDTLDGLTDLNEQIAALVRDAVRAKAMADALKIIIEDNASRKQRFEAKAERLRALALWALTEANIQRVEAPDMTISQVPGRPSVVITDEAAIPDEFCKLIRVPKKTEIAEELKSGRFVPYAVWSNPEKVLRVQTK
jgi:hypothetical protein